MQDDNMNDLKSPEMGKQKQRLTTSHLHQKQRRDSDELQNSARENNGYGYTSFQQNKTEEKAHIIIPSSLYRLKLNFSEYLDEGDTISEATKFIEKYGLLKESYNLPSNDQIQQWIIYWENLLKDVKSVEGDESAIVEMYFYEIFLVLMDDDIFKVLVKTRDALYNARKCPVELIVMVQFIYGVCFEKNTLVEAESSYLLALIHYLFIYGDPRGRGNVAHPFF